MRKMRWFIDLLVVAAAAGLAFGAWSLWGPAAKPLAIKGQVKAVQPLQLTAVGDSLTHGVGDDSNNGGYVGLIKNDLESTGNYRVTTSNFGVTGDTSSQIQKRVDKQPKLQAAVKKANIITVTVGGNDLMHVLQKHLLSLSDKDVATGSAQFQKRLGKLLKTFRQLNPKAPIYVFGIYNPFYVYFPKLTAMTTSVKTWNAGTQQTVNQFKQAYYVDIDSVLTKGTNTQATDKKTKASLAAAMSDDSNSNPLIFTEDHFHPNNAGYALMTSQLWQKMEQTKQTWE